MKINNDSVCLHEGVTYLWENDEAIPIKKEIENLKKVHAPLFILKNGKVISLT